MAKLDKTTLLGKFTSAVSGLFKANITKAIGSDDLRTFVEDTTDSMLFEYDNSVMRDCGTVDLSSDAWPTTGGKGEIGAILKNNFFRVAVGGDPPGADNPIVAGMLIVANQDSPTTGAHWDVMTSDGSGGGITTVDGGTI